VLVLVLVLVLALVLALVLRDSQPDTRTTGKWRCKGGTFGSSRMKKRKDFEEEEGGERRRGGDRGSGPPQMGLLGASTVLCRVTEALLL